VTFEAKLRGAIYHVYEQAAKEIAKLGLAFTPFSGQFVVSQTLCKQNY
jgi:hypothetical protein